MMLRETLLKTKMQQLNLEWFIISAAWDIEWLTGFTGSNGTVVLSLSGQPTLLTDFRYKEQSAQETNGINIVITNQSYLDELKEQQIFLSGRVGFQSDITSFSSYQAMLKKLPSTATLVPIDDFCSEFTAVKNKQEIQLIQEATNITTKVFEKILEIISPKVTERDIAAEISYLNKRFGANGDSFPPIVAGGARGALPHAKPSDHFIENNSLIVIDMGCRYQGYCSDQTRTIAIGKPSEEMKEVYQITLDAHLIGIENAIAGRTGKEIDASSRSYIQSKGYGDYFGHGLGHGVGIQIHENPRLNAKSTDVIKENAVVTIEPGIYLPNKFGVRIEDAVVVTPSGGKSLATSPKHLITI